MHTLLRLSVFAASLLPVGALAFYDTVDGTLYSGAAVALQEAGIVQGYDDGGFHPYDTINRAEFTKILAGARFEGSEVCEAKRFSDVSADEWYSPSIDAAFCRGVIDGYPDGTFRPANDITMAEAAKILAKAYGLPIENTDTWYEGPVRAMVAANAVPTTIPSLDYPITRGDMAEMINDLRGGTPSAPTLVDPTYLLQLPDTSPWTPHGERMVNEEGGFSIEYVDSETEYTREVLPYPKADGSEAVVYHYRVPYIGSLSVQDWSDGDTADCAAFPANSNGSRFMTRPVTVLGKTRTVVGLRRIGGSGTIGENGVENVQNMTEFATPVGKFCVRYGYDVDSLPAYRFEISMQTLEAMVASIRLK